MQERRVSHLREEQKPVVAGSAEGSLVKGHPSAVALRRESLFARIGPIATKNEAKVATRRRYFSSASSPPRPSGGHSALARTWLPRQGHRAGRRKNSSRRL